MAKGSLLIVDDDAPILESMAEYLREQKYRVEVARDYEQAVDRLANIPFAVVITDVCLEDKDGLDLLRYVRENHTEAETILITGYGSIENAVEAIRLGAFDYLTKPLLGDELLLSIRRALSQRELVVENQSLKAQLDMRFGLESLIGHDYRMLKVFDLIDSVADTRTTVLITGESGTGKTLCARAIHRRSSRRDKPFVEVACGALPETLLESELFGHKAGSFTGAISDKMGKFQQADEGTIFLDEIATSTAGLQVKLLRVLQDMEFEPVGGTETHRVDARLILATNRDLTEMVEKGEFRQDLYYRINVVVIDLAPLRDRIGDIPLLAEHFLQDFREQTGRKVRGFSDEAMTLLQSYRWPGNVRELENVVERAVVLGKQQTITAEDLPAVLKQGGIVPLLPVGQRTLKQALEVPERRILLETLEACHWNRQQTAESLGINRTTLYKKMKRLGLEYEPSMAHS